MKNEATGANFRAGCRSAPCWFRCAFTVPELVLLLCFLGIFAGLLLPIHGPNRKVFAKIAQARFELKALESAINQFHTDYGHFPISTNAVRDDSHDFTFGTVETAAVTKVFNSKGHQANNSVVISILIGLSKLPNGKLTVGNENEKRMTYLNARFAKDSDSSGIGSDGVYRDPWKNPYIISFELNGDGVVEDALYGRLSTNLVFTNRFIIWSFGADGKADPKLKPDEGVNKDNILSWK
jgi:type II secretory pathway pseudopilin PulG